ncbi:MAG: MBL fold metallo-hydrolase [Lachnospiraceae bacterium]|nr:MBL fold metallo-hydrolase [Lachnospiraceae bacterium]
MTEQTEVLRYIVGPVCTNCYLLVNHKTGELLVVDPGDQAQLIEKQIEKTGAKPVAILLTHGHFDHAGAAEELADKYQISIYAHEAEKETLEDPRLNLCGMIGEHKVYHADIFVKDEEVLNLAGFSIRVFFTPGHTIGGCCYYIADEKILFSGDTLFQESVGRTDFPRGSASDLIRAIREKLMPLPDDVTVYTGHDESTLIGYERMHNPYL